MLLTAFNWVDYIIIAVILFSTVISVMRGAVREIISLASWWLAFWSALTYYLPLTSSFSLWIEREPVRIFLAFAAIFLFVLLLGCLVNTWLSHWIIKSGLSPMDRGFGVLFGMARGALLIALLVLFATLTALPKNSWWQASQLTPVFIQFSNQIKTQFPKQIKAISGIVSQSSQP